MADWIISNKKQSYAEKRQWDFDFNPDLISGVTVSSATGTHVPPGGSTVTGTVTVGSAVAGVVPVMLQLAALQLGTHYLKCLATLSNTEKSELVVVFQVDF